MKVADSTRNFSKEKSDTSPYSYKPKDKEAAEKAGLISKNGNFLFAGRVVIANYASRPDRQSVRKGCG